MFAGEGKAVVVVVNKWDKVDTRLWTVEKMEEEVRGVVFHGRSHPGTAETDVTLSKDRPDWHHTFKATVVMEAGGMDDHPPNHRWSHPGTAETGVTHS